MAGGLPLLLGRMLFLAAVPLGACLVGVEADRFVDILSIVACLAELGLFAFASPGRKKKGGGNDGRRSLRPARMFPLQLLLLYCMQLWLLLFHHVAIGAPARTVHHDAALREPAAVAPSEGVALAEEPLPQAAQALPQGNLRQQDVPAQAAAAPVALALPAGINGFQLDAPPETLRWDPKTISIVLPCAEEREYAFKTVKSFFEMTPSHILHEIVVVDDGSNPPLSQTHLGPDVQKHYKVKICRHEKTVGLIGAKKTGGDAATGDIVAFMDCHVAPQKDWYKDFIHLIGHNYRRMVIPDITALDVETWTQVGGGGGMSKCYVTWDGDFKWGGPEDMYMGMLSGGLAGMSKRWWNETGGFDDKMLGWGGENIDQGVRMWVCGGEIVAAPNSQVAHMWRTGDAKTSARYKHVGDTTFNRARAVHAWFGEFSRKLDDYPVFHSRVESGGEHWYGDMSSFQKVKDRLQGCRPFAWYLRRFKYIYEDAGLVPPDIFMIQESSTGLCLRYQGQAGTSGNGREGVRMTACNPKDDRFFWHLGNVQRKTGACCSGLRAWNTDQCFGGMGQRGEAATGICQVEGKDPSQFWSLDEDGLLRSGNTCLGPGDRDGGITQAPCLSFRNKGTRWAKFGTRIPIERELYDKAQREHPEVFTLLNQQLEAMKPKNVGPKACSENKGACRIIVYVDPSGSGVRRCIDDQGGLSGNLQLCAPVLIVGMHVKKADGGQCLDSWSDADPETWGWYDCHDGDNQKIHKEGGSRLCSVSRPEECFLSERWPVRPR